MDFDPLVLARIQFAANISFHILFPTVTIGLCWILLFFRLCYTFTRDRNWEFAYYFWVKIFALSFAIGVVSGLTMSFQFGTNWPGFMLRAGNIAGPLLGYEVLSAFFLEATFLGVMLFGKHRVSNRFHLVACALVALGTTLSAFWILSLNSWMQTPAGYVMTEEGFDVGNWSEIIFNPSFVPRFIHMLLAALLTASFMLMGVSAWRIRRNIEGPGTWLVLKTGLWIAVVLAPLQIVAGDFLGLNTREHQPAKIAAIEAVWKTEAGVPFTLFAWPDETLRQNRFALTIPKAGSLILTHDPDGVVQGLNEFEDHPPVAIVFWSFRVMVGVGMLMVLTAWWAGWRYLWRQHEPQGLLLGLLSWMTFSGWVAVLAGWYVTEIGRQPWLVYGVLRTSDMVAAHDGGMVLGTLLGYLALYVFILIAYMATLRYLASKPAASLVATDPLMRQPAGENH